MRYIWQHITTIINTYDGSMPLTHFLKNYFRQYPVLGSRDRKALSAMAYAFYRCGRGLGTSGAIEGRIKKCLELCQSDLANDSRLFATVSEVMEEFDIDRLFPYSIALSDGIDKSEWLASMLRQPDLFIRVRKDREHIAALLDEHNIPFTFLSDNCIGLPNGAKIDTVLPEKSYAVQDASSQLTGTFFSPHRQELWYDCCSGAGGKSLLLKDMEPTVKLTVSDKRDSILHNLKQRFKLYGHQLPTAYTTDTSSKEQLENTLKNARFDNIICDAPCSGSGTWARTPEQLYFFDEASISRFSALQRSIAANVSRYLKPGGRLIYITCSVFRQENEDVVNAVLEETQLELANAQLINGINAHADSMFVAVIKKPAV